jgi:hypothetical protein
MGQPITSPRSNLRAGENDLKFLKSIWRGPFNSPRKMKGSRLNFAVYGMPVKKLRTEPVSVGLASMVFQSKADGPMTAGLLPWAVA